MSPPATSGVPERFTAPGVHASIHALDSRVARVEEQTSHLPQLVSDMKEVKDGLATFKGYEAMIKHLIGKGVLLIIGAVGSAFGVAKATEPTPPIMTPAPSKSASTVRLEAIQAMAPGPDRDRELIKFIVETSPTGQR